MAGVLRSKDNPVVFLDIVANKQKLGRITIELFKDLAPKAAQNFRQLCTGQYLYKGKPAGYKETLFHKVSPEVLIEGGDFMMRGDPEAERKLISIYSEPFKTESVEVAHDQAGYLSMVCNSKGLNGHIFQITASSCPELNGKFGVIGKVIDQASLKVIKAIALVQVAHDGKPKIPIVIQECGEM